MKSISRVDKCRNDNLLLLFAGCWNCWQTLRIGAHISGGSTTACRKRVANNLSYRGGEPVARGRPTSVRRGGMRRKQVKISVVSKGENVFFFCTYLSLCPFFFALQMATSIRVA